MTKYLRTIVFAVAAAASAVAADLEWKYEGTAPEPVTDTGTSVEPVEFSASRSDDALSAAYGTGSETCFYTFLFSVGSDVQETEFLSTKPSGMIFIVR